MEKGVERENRERVEKVGGEKVARGMKRGVERENKARLEKVGRERR